MTTTFNEAVSLFLVQTRNKVSNNNSDPLNLYKSFIRDVFSKNFPVNPESTDDYIAFIIIAICEEPLLSKDEVENLMNIIFQRLNGYSDSSMSRIQMLIKNYRNENFETICQDVALIFALVIFCTPLSPFFFLPKLYKNWKGRKIMNKAIRKITTKPKV